MVADTSLFEFLSSLDEYQVLLMKNKYSFKELVAARTELISRFKAQNPPVEKKLEEASARPAAQKKPTTPPVISTKTAKPVPTSLDKALIEKAEWNKAWHIARTNGGKMWWDGYRKGIKDQRKIQHSDKPESNE